MVERGSFFDTNVPLYLFSADADKAERAETLLMAGGQISVQVLNEFAAVTRRKFGLSWDEVEESLAVLRRFCRVMPLTLGVHEQGLLLAQRYGFAVYDAMIVAAALTAGCTTLYSEDLQDGQRIDDILTIRNPFKP